MSDRELLLAYGRATDQMIKDLQDDPDLAVAGHAMSIVSTSGTSCLNIHVFVVRDKELLKKWADAAVGFKQS